MLKNFFQLNEPNTEITSQEDFEGQLAISKHLTNILYRPDVFKSNFENTKLKILNTSFTNVSFTKTELSKVYFDKCNFKDCLFIGTNIIDCEFHNCTFQNVNTHKIKINNTYINPSCFEKNLNDFNKANICTHLFQQLLNNSKDYEQSKFARNAQYNFEKWKTRNIYKQCFLDNEPKVSFWKFLRDYPINWIFKWTFGFGLRLRNFIITFSILFSFFFYQNSNNWSSYKFVNKSRKIEGFSIDSTNFTSNLYYTLEATTKLVDSQLQPTSSIGMNWLLVQSILGFVLLSALVTIIINRFVK
ncbi:pentapeptide repeat-containing protein [Tenacibaculum sp. S7007]|uniref:Pentapeptide repeat-containing protein n=1 Tax=Tenacibaculum pelagium TaxID=2759527 RepID=A0A839AQZ4_9FLAO|nr:pentapeptide repeat-containing protein [Tenacibaculum pelagium]MBA6156768.1 pentapeptide repeat-containing protein [Tenacibaculum pelagium]